MTQKTSTPRTPLRADIQVLRAVAVMGVVGFHLWPTLVPFGFVGVDIFFVISGFLITSHLVTEVDRSGRIRLGQFWSRRIRRLLPSAFVVILVTSIFVFLYQSQSTWQDFIRQAVGSTFYFENWILAFDSVDYLNADNAPTAVQQYWSLSVEEQFYLVWPILILLAVLLGRRRGAPESAVSRMSITVVLGALVVLSFGCSMWFGLSHDPSGYFSTFTRMWEFGLGGLVAVALVRLRAVSVRWSRVLAISGWAVLGVSAVVIRPDSMFPGYIAALPVVATALVIVGGSMQSRMRTVDDARPWLKPAIFLGGISYAIYLWHWPAVTLFPSMFGHLPTAVEKGGILLFCIAIAWLSTVTLERPLQRAPFLVNRRPWFTMVVALVAAGVTLVPSVIVSVNLDSRLAAEAAQREVLLADSCFGAQSSLNADVCRAREWPLLSPDPVFAQTDLPSDANACKTDTLEVKVCQFGSIGASTRVALIGDSHAGHWFPALNKLATDDGFQLDIYQKSSCTFKVGKRTDTFAPCSTWSQEVIDMIASGPAYDVVIVTALAENLANEVGTGDLTETQVVSDYHDTWEPLLAMGSHVVVIRDTPHMAEGTQACVVKNAAVDAGALCALTPNEAFRTTDYEALAATVGVASPLVDPRRITLIDLTDVFCTPNCQPVISGGVVFSDSHHMTKTFSESFAAVVRQRLSDVGISL